MPPDQAHDLLWRPSTWRVELKRYALAACLVVSAAVAAAFVGDQTPSGEVASETDEAVLLDLPPALASSTPKSDAADGPEKPASEAAVATPPPPEVAPDSRPDEPPKDMAKDEPSTPAEVPPPPVEAKPEAVLPPPRESPIPEKAPPPPVAAAPAQDEAAPAGSPAPVRTADPVESEAARRRAAQAMSRWQQAILVRLQVARSGLRAAGEAGVATVAFAIDRRGRIVSSRIARSSGSAQLDRIALALLARAAPFPGPPAGSAEATLHFTVPVAFEPRR